MTFLFVRTSGLSCFGSGSGAATACGWVAGGQSLVPWPSALKTYDILTLSYLQQLTYIVYSQTDSCGPQKLNEF